MVAPTVVSVAKLAVVVAVVLTIVALAIVGPQTLIDHQVIQVFCVLRIAIAARADGAIVACGGLYLRRVRAIGCLRRFVLALPASGLGGQGRVLGRALWGEILSLYVITRAHMVVVIALVGLSDICRLCVSNLGRPGDVHVFATLSCAHQQIGKTVASCRCGLCGGVVCMCLVCFTQVMSQAPVR